MLLSYLSVRPIVLVDGYLSAIGAVNGPFCRLRQTAGAWETAHVCSGEGVGTGGYDGARLMIHTGV